MPLAIGIELQTKPPLGGWGGYSRTKVLLHIVPFNPRPFVIKHSKAPGRELAARSIQNKKLP
jgi:hypothetical protein